MIERNRVSRGVPTGGQFAEQQRADAEVSLSELTHHDEFTQRNQARFSADPRELTELAATAPAEVLYLVARNLSTPPEVLDQIARRSKSTVVRVSAAINPYTPASTVKMLANDARPEVAYFARRHHRYVPSTFRERFAARVAAFIEGRTVSA